MKTLIIAAYAICSGCITTHKTEVTNNIHNANKYHFGVYVRDKDNPTKWDYLHEATKPEVRRVFNLKDNAFRDLGTTIWKPITQDTITIAK